jgi:hypothetical protein
MHVVVLAPGRNISAQDNQRSHQTVFILVRQGLPSPSAHFLVGSRTRELGWQLCINGLHFAFAWLNALTLAIPATWMPGKTQNSPIRDAAVRRMFQGKVTLSSADNEQNNVAEQRTGGDVSAYETKRHSCSPITWEGGKVVSFHSSFN